MQATTAKRGRKRVYDAARTRDTILKAAEAAFANHGFDGVSVDAIAAEAGYNKSLIFQYFGNKLGLYAAVLKRADQEMSALLARAFAPLHDEETLAADARQFQAFLRTAFEAFLDYMLEHPHFTRMLNWEQAAGWKTFAGIASQFGPTDLARLDALFAKARRAGLLRPDLDVACMILLVQQICWSTPGALPMYQLLMAADDSAPGAPLDYVRHQIIDFLVAGVVCHSPDPARPGSKTQRKDRRI